MIPCNTRRKVFLMHRMQKWESQAGSSSCMRPGARFHPLPHKQEGAQQQGNDYLISLADWTPPGQDWQVLRLVGTGPQQDGVHRCLTTIALCVLAVIDCCWIATRGSPTEHSLPQPIISLHAPYTPACPSDLPTSRGCPSLQVGA